MTELRWGDIIKTRQGNHYLFTNGYYFNYTTKKIAHLKHGELRNSTILTFEEIIELDKFVEKNKNHKTNFFQKYGPDGYDAMEEYDDDEGNYYHCHDVDAEIVRLNERIKELEK